MESALNINQASFIFGVASPLHNLLLLIVPYSDMISLRLMQKILLLPLVQFALQFLISS